MSISGLFRAVAAILHTTALAIWRSYRLGFATLIAAPALVALAAVPEFVQHVVEIRLGMFASRGAFGAVANAPLRWDFGYAKVAGLILAILLVARFWAKDGSLRAALSIRWRTFARAALAIGVMVGVGFALAPERMALPQPLDIARLIVSWIAQTAIGLWLVGVWVDDPAMTVRRAFTDRFPNAILILLLFLIAMLPGQALHRADHFVAFGRPEPIVWALMVFDLLVVGTIAAISGASLYVGYAAQFAWRGGKAASPEQGGN